MELSEYLKTVKIDSKQALLKEVEKILSKNNEDIITLSSQRDSLLKTDPDSQNLKEIVTELEGKISLNKKLTLMMLK